MDIEWLIFVILVFTTFVNQGVQMYVHFEAYPLLPFVGKAEFATYLKEYESRLAVPLLAPYGLTILSNLLLIFLRPDGVSLVAVILALILNVAVAGVTMRVATPVYLRIQQA